jgi:hypothetical protein
MKPQDSVRLATAIGPAAIISPPLALHAALVGVGLPPQSWMPKGKI